MAGDAEGTPGDMEPAIAGQELVGILTCLKERDELLELLRVTRADIGSAALEVLGISDATNAAVDGLVAEAGVNDNGAADGLSGGLQQLAATVGYVGNLLDGWDVLRVLLPIAELGQRKVRR